MRISVVLFLLAVLFSLTARADEVDARARDLYTVGVRNYNLQRFTEALEQFQSAYELKPDPALLFNIGQCQRNLGQREAAVRSFLAYLEQVPGAPNRDHVRHMVDQLRAAPRAEVAPAAVRVPDPQLVVAAPAPPASDSIERRLRRPWYRRTEGMVLASVGLAGLVAGSALMGASNSYVDAARGATTLPRQRADLATADTFMPVGIAVASIGGASFVVGGILLAVQK